MTRQSPEFTTGGFDQEGGAERTDISTKKIANSAIDLTLHDISSEDGENKETDQKEVRAIDFIKDHFPEEIIHKAFSVSTEQDSLRPEEYFRREFDTFRQEELTVVTEKGKEFLPPAIIWNYKDTASFNIHKTEDAVKTLSGENGKLPPADVCIYLDKSGRPVSWFVDEFWDKFSKMPKPQTEHLAIDRKTWFEYFGIELDPGEYLKGTRTLATWLDIPISKVDQSEITKLCSYLKDGIVSLDEIPLLLHPMNSSISNTVKTRLINRTFKKERVQERMSSGELTSQSQIAHYIDAAKQEAHSLLLDRERLDIVKEAFLIASRLRGLFVRGGLSEDDLKHPERIFDYPTDFDDKNIVIIDEFSRTGTTEEIAKHLVSWAFPEAKSVSLYVYDKGEKYSNSSSPIFLQPLRIPFWYSLQHDDGTGRGIADTRKGAYERRYKEHPDNLRRAQLYGADFLSTPIDYFTEKDQKSLRLREQIAHLRKEYDDGVIPL